MATVETKDIRNVALVGHGGGGKTILTEALLHKAGAIKRIGTITDGNTVSDFNPDEKEKQHSIDTAAVHFSHAGAYVNLLDTPGYPDYIGAAIGALAAVETAVVVVNAAHGVLVNTRRMWKAATEAKLARVVVVSRMDSDNIDVEGVLSRIREMFGESCLPMNLPVGKGGAFTGVEGTLFAAKGAKKVIGEMAAAHNALVEAVVEADDAVMETYLEGGEVSDEELARATAKAVAMGLVTPVLFCAAQKDLGVAELLDMIVRFAPSPATGKIRVAVDREGHELPIKPVADGPFFAQVFKMVTDPFVGKLSYLRIFGGTLKADKPIYNQRAEKSERIGNLIKLQGKEQQPVDAATAGEIVAIAKLDEVRISDTFCDSGGTSALRPIAFPVPMVSLAVEPGSRKDETKITGALSKLADEDATFLVRRDRETKQLVVSGTSDLHLETMLGRLRSRFEVDVVTSIPKVPFKETIVKSAQAQHKHKKQTGGRGQYGEVYLKVEPLPRGSGFEFVDAIVGGSIPGQYLPAIEKGVREAMGRGVIAGYEFVDARVTVYDGSFHSVDSSEAAFKMAGSKAFRKAVLDAQPVLLEPIVNMEITIPNQYMGDITGDINSRRGRIMGVGTEGNYQVVQTMVPLAEVMSYSTQLRSMTGGEGSFSMEFSHLDIVPSKIADPIKARFKGHEEED